MGGRRFETIPDLIPFGKHIKALREARELNQEDAAADMGLDRGYLSGIENAKRNPSTLQLLKIAKGLGVTPCDLFAYLETTSDNSIK